jgi:2-iminoacetate synthase ThiH
MAIETKLQTSSILDAVLEERTLLPEEALHLLQLTHPEDLQQLQKTANEMAHRQTKKSFTSAFSCSLFLTNLCELQANIYPYVKQPGQTGAYTLTIDDIDAVLELSQTQNNPHVTISGGGFWSNLRIPGLEKASVLKTYQHLLNHVREKCPNIKISGFSPDEVEFLSIISNQKPRYILDLLKDHGLKTLGGYQSGLLVSGVRKKISPKLMPVKDWLSVVQTATKLGMPTLLQNQLGHLETLSDRVQHLTRIREFLQKQTKQYDSPFFAGLIPQLITANPKTQADWPGMQHATPQDRLKWLAVCRLFLGAWIPNQQSFWQIESSDPLDEAQVGLQSGANMLGNTDVLAFSGFLLGNQTKGWLFPQFTPADLQKYQREYFDIPVQSH